MDATDDTGLEERVAQVRQVKRFGEEELGLDFWETMFSVVNLDTPWYYSVYASRKDRIESAFTWRKSRFPYKVNAFLAHYPLLREIPPLTAKIPGLHEVKYDLHLSYGTDKNAAEEKVQELEGQGFDVILSCGEAVGGPDCEIVRSLLEADPVRRAFAVLHEGFHAHMGQHLLAGGTGIPDALEEPLGTSVGFAGAIEYFKEHNPGLVGDVQRQEEDWSGFCEFVVRYHERLSGCYSRKGEEKEEILAQAREEAEQLKEGFTTSWLRRWDTSRFNNAWFLRQITYAQHQSLVNNTLDSIPLRDYLADPDPVNARLIKAVKRLRHG